MAEHVNIFLELERMGADMDHHESDLYVRATPETRAAVKASRYYHTFFRSEIDGKTWIEIPFAFYPFWANRIDRA